MRTSPLAAATAASATLLTVLLLSATPGAAQMPSATYVFKEAVGPLEAVVPGGTAQFNFTVERTCAFAGDVLPETSAKVEFRPEGNLTVAGPGQVQFPQQVCAQQSMATVQFQATVVVPPGAEARIHKLQVALHPEPTGTVPRYAQEASMDFIVKVASPPAEPTPQADDPAPAPAAGAILMALVLGMAALVVRRR